MMDRRRFLVTSLAGPLAAPLAAGAQQAEKVFRIGYLSGNSAESDTDLRSAFRQGLAELGYVEGKGSVIEYRYAAAQAERLPALAAELVQSKIDVSWSSPPQFSRLKPPWREPLRCSSWRMTR
jgi:putative tryptophan/tyrosine transport system substrate-binding protein